MRRVRTRRLLGLSALFLAVPAMVSCSVLPSGDPRDVVEGVVRGVDEAGRGVSELGQGVAEAGAALDAARRELEKAAAGIGAAGSELGQSLSGLFPQAGADMLASLGDRLGEALATGLPEGFPAAEVPLVPGDEPLGAADPASSAFLVVVPGAAGGVDAAETLLRDAGFTPVGAEVVGLRTLEGAGYRVVLSGDASRAVYVVSPR